MNAPQAFQAALALSEARQIGYPYPGAISHNHIGYLTGPCNEKGKLSIQFTRQGGNMAGKLTRYNLASRDLTTV